MKVLIVNTTDKGGAANSCERLHNGLLALNIDSKVVLKSKQNNWPNSFRYAVVLPKSKFLNALYKIKRKFVEIIYDFRNRKQIEFLIRRSPDLSKFSFPNTTIDITQCRRYIDADIINLHWVANFLDYTSFFQKNNKPVIWTLHDMNPFSGGEHYEEIYEGVDSNGAPQKRKPNEDEKKIILSNLKLKKGALANVNNLTIVAPSQWLAKEARKSELFKEFPVICIPNGLDSEMFKPRNKSFSREMLGVDKDKKVILFVADSVNDKRKGFEFLLRAIDKLVRNDIVLCAIGELKSYEKPSCPIVELGYIKDERMMSLAYSAADVFVIPSLMDNLPNTVLESLMCGTPVIGFPVGGIPEMIKHGENGLLTKSISVDDLVETINIYLDSSDSFDRQKIRENAMNLYDQKIQATKYSQLFESILNNVRVTI